MWSLVYADDINQQQCKIKVLNINARELVKDLNSAIEFDQTHLFKLIYTQEFDQAGGQPYGLIIADYYFSHQATQDFPDSISVLSALANIGSQAFTPFISSIHANQMGLDSFADLKPQLDLGRVFQQKEYARWRSLQSSEQAKFLGLTMPRVLIRAPYDKQQNQNKFYHETIQQHGDYLWGNACYHYAAVVLRCFSATGWLADIRGDADDMTSIASGVTHLSRYYLSTDAPMCTTQLVCELLITDNQAKQLNELGFIPLQDNLISHKSIFYSAQSMYLAEKPNIHSSNIKHEKYSNNKINSMLHYLLCAARFSHYIKIIMREKIGTYLQDKQCEQYINQWLNQYCSAASNQSAMMKAKYPLNSAHVKLASLIGKPGEYRCEITIAPHYQLDEIEAQLNFITKI